MFAVHGLAQTQNISEVRQLDFNLRDSRIWSQELAKIDLIQSTDGQGVKISLMKFRSADGAFQIKCQQRVAGTADVRLQDSAEVSCRIRSDVASSARGKTQFQSVFNGRGQRIRFQDPQDLAQLNRLVGDERSRSYRTTRMETVFGGHHLAQVPQLEASCKDGSHCEVTLVGPGPTPAP